ncbi:MAG: hypothetical protein J5J06_15010 [Phycisphaerae bacterium]|nr:hypothetical protein [Phycisphaerae bacterium]
MHHHRNVIARSVLCAVAIILFGVGISPAADLAAGSSVSVKGSEALEKLRFLHGQWERRDGEDELTEYWSAPSGDSITGVFRWLKNGKTWMYELLTITAEGDRIVFRLRHFSAPGLIPWEKESDSALAYTLSSLGEGEAVFEDPARAFPRRFIFRKVGDDGLMVRFDGVRNGQPTAQEFSYTRKRFAE